MFPNLQRVLYIKKERQQREQIDEDIKEEEQIRHFKKLFKGEEARRTQEEEKKNSRKWEEETEEEKFIITEQEIERAISKLKKKKATGEDGISNEAWLKADKKTRGKLKDIQKICNREKIPEEWKEGQIFPIYKKEDKQKIQNYRGINLSTQDIRYLQ